MTERFRDFDVWDAERRGEPVRFRVCGKDFELPATLPAIIPIRVMRLKRDYASDSEVPPDVMTDLALSLFGEEQLAVLLDTGIDIDTLAEIVGWVIEQYSGAAPGNAAAPEGAPSTSSNTGES